MSLSRSALLIVGVVLTLATIAVAGADAPAAAPTAAAQAHAAQSASTPTDAAPSLAYRLWRFAGVFHPLVVHFPIALLLIAGGIELARACKIMHISRDATWICLLVGAVTAILAATLGWANAAGVRETQTLSIHRWLGVSMTVLAVTLAAVTTWQRYRPHIRPGRVYLAAMAILAAGVGFTGHLGGQLVYGDDFIGRAWKNVMEPAAPAPAEHAPDEPADALGDPLDLDDPDAAVNFAQHVWPILQGNCLECHGPDQQDGRLRLDTEKTAREGGRSGPAYEPGNAEFSLMFELVTSPFESDRMPPADEKPPLSDREITILERWINQGADWQPPPDNGQIAD